MKNVLTVALATLLTCALSAQNLATPTKWKLRKIGVSFGTDLDMIQGLDYAYLIQTGKGNSTSIYNNVSFGDQQYYAAVCENPNIRITAVLDVPRLKNTELEFSLNTIFNRFDGIYYYAEDSRVVQETGGFQYLSVNSVTNEVGLESIFTKRLNLFNFLNLYGGLGANIGYSFDGEMQISGHEYRQSVDQNVDRSLKDVTTGTIYSDAIYESYDAKDAFHQRLIYKLGFGIVFCKRLELGLDYRGGWGYRAVFGAPTKNTRLESVALSAKWILK